LDVSTFICDMLGLDLGRNIGYPDWRISCFSQVRPCRCWDSTPDYATTAFFQIFSNLLFTAHPVIRRCIFRPTDNVVK
jgi:hypothetical protein